MFGKLFSSGATALIGSVKGLVTAFTGDKALTQEQDALLKQAIEDNLHSMRVAAEETHRTEIQAKERVIVAEMKQSSVFVKAARPMVVYSFVFTVMCAVVKWAFMGDPAGLEALNDIPDRLWDAWVGVMSVWMISRGVEKVAPGVVGAIAKKVTNRQGT